MERRLRQNASLTESLSEKKNLAFFTCSLKSAVRFPCLRSQNLPKFRDLSIERLTRQEKLKSWEEPLAVEEDLFEVNYTPPSNVLNVDQDRELSEIKSWIDAGTFKVGLLYGVTGSGKTEVYLRSCGSGSCARQDGADSGP